jgi:2-hydroxy-3-oxopropionate reductase
MIMPEQAQDMAIQRVAVIGVGRMGGPMAQHLAQAGFSVRAFDSSRQALAALEAFGVKPADSARSAAEGVDVIITMLPSNDALHAVIEGPEGILPVLHAGQIIIDMSTSKPASVQALAAKVQQQGVAMLDAPVSGGTSGAQQATLSIMVGGEKSVYERCLPLFQAMGTTITYIGASGMGGIAKLVNQMLMEATFCAVAEAFGMAAKAGADLEAVYAAVRDGHGGSRVLDQMLPALLSGELGTGRELTLHHKDGAYALDTAAALDAWVPVTQLSHELFDTAFQQGHGEQSASAVARVFAERMGIQIGKL